MIVDLLDPALSQTFDEEASVELIAKFLGDRTPRRRVTT